MCFYFLRRPRQAAQADEPAGNKKIEGEKDLGHHKVGEGRCPRYFLSVGRDADRPRQHNLGQANYGSPQRP